MNRQEKLSIRKGLLLAVVRSRREAESTIKRLKEQVETLDKELGRYRQRELQDAAANDAKETLVSFGTDKIVPPECETAARTLDNAGIEATGTPFLQHQPRAHIARHSHLADLLASAAAETAALLERSGLQEEDVRFVAEVRAMQLAQARVQGSSTAGVARQPATTGLYTHTPHSIHAASHGPNSWSRASQTAEGECTCSYAQRPGDTHGAAQGTAISESAAQHALWGLAPERLPHSAQEHARCCGSLASALTAVVDFLLHGVLNMQPCSLRRSYAGSAFSCIHAIQAAWPGESHALASVLDRLSSGLIAQAAQDGASCSILAADFLQEFLEAPLTGQAVFRAAARELKSAVDALPDNARGEEAILGGQMQQIEALCDVLDAAVLKLPDWLSQPEPVLSSAPSQDSLSQAMESILRAHTSCEARREQAPAGNADRLKALAVQLLITLQHLKGYT